MRYHSHDAYSLMLHKEKDPDRCDEGKLVVKCFDPYNTVPTYILEVPDYLRDMSQKLRGTQKYRSPLTEMEFTFLGDEVIISSSNGKYWTRNSTDSLVLFSTALTQKSAERFTVPKIYWFYCNFLIFEVQWQFIVPYHLNSQNEILQ